MPNIMQDLGTKIGSEFKTHRLRIEAVETDKQENLVSGTNIKTINGTSVLGSGDIVTTQTTISGNAGTATKLATARTISLTGDVTGNVSFDGSANVSITTTVADDSHNHIISNIDGLQTALDSKLGTTGKAADSDLLDGQEGSYYLNASNLNAGTIADARLPDTITSSITGNAATATTLSTNRGNYKNTTDSAVVGELMWKNYGNDHTIFDASNSKTPTGVAKNNTNPDIAWSPTFPTLMGYNGDNTYGVRVDSSRYADSATTATKANTINNSGSALTFNWSGQSGQPTWLYGGNDPSNAYVYNPSNFSVNYATSATYAATAPVGTNTTQIATTAFVLANSGVLTPTTVGAATAALAYKSVGSYILGGLVTASINNQVAGSTLAGSSIATGEENIATGTWRAMGDPELSGNGQICIFLRIA